MCLRENGRWRLALCMIPLVVMACLQEEAIGDSRHGMVLIPAQRVVVGTNERQRQELAKRFDCHPTWLGDDLPQHETALPAFWIDRHPVTNAQYLAFVEATGHGRPSWWGRWGGTFPAEYADHPVAGVSGTDASSYAKWAGKRLLTAEGWEAAIGDPNRAPFPWGRDWPGRLELHRPARIFWELPGTRPVGTGGCGHSTTGVEDFAGQVLEWVSDVRPHHGVQFQLMKAANWFQEDPLSFRTAAGWWPYEGWRSSFTGFRCALDADKTPPPVRTSDTRISLSATAARGRLRDGPPAGPVTLSAVGGTSRHLSICAPRYGQETFSLSTPETIIWNGESVMTWRKTPEMTWRVRTPERATYEMRFDELRVDAEFLAGEDFVEQRFTATNLTDRPASFTTSSCFSLQTHPMFYDCEQLRTYVLAADGTFAPMRRFSRGGNCVRWITGPTAKELGEPLRWSVLAVVSRDGRRIVATGRAGNATAFSIATNTLFTCLHTDSTVRVKSAGKTITRQFFWFLEATLDDLHTRCRRDLDLP